MNYSEKTLSLTVPRAETVSIVSAIKHSIEDRIRVAKDLTYCDELAAYSVEQAFKSARALLPLPAWLQM